MWKPLALVLVGCALVSTPFALAQTGGNPTPTPDAEGSNPPAPPCVPMKSLLNHRHWRERDPLRGETVCPNPRAAKLKEAFHRWRVYRLLTPYAGCSGGGKWLRYTAVPGYVVSHESGCSWSAVNSSSGACGPYQLNGWTSCATSSWGDKMRHHRTAAMVLRVQGLGPAWTSNW